jgi:FHS family L-fucose permease-like MFS transporter
MAAPVSTSPNTTSNAAVTTNYTAPLIIVITLFFTFGFVTNLNDILIPHLKRACELTDFQSSLVQFAFFGAYFLMSIPAGNILNRIGYKNGIVLGLGICALGAFLFLPAAFTRQYPFFLLALAVLASGVTLLQVAANPYVSVLGPAHKAASRLSLMGAFNSLAGTLSPLIGGMLLLSGVDYTAQQIAEMSDAEKLSFLSNEASLVITPYLVIGSVLLLLAFIAFRTKMPNIESLQDEHTPVAAESDKTSALQFRHLVLGIGAIFVYVGAEVGVGSFIIRYGQDLHITNLSSFTSWIFSLGKTSDLGSFTAQIGSKFVACYWGGSMIGRFIGIPLLTKINDAKALRIVCAIATLLIVASVALTGETALWLMVLVGMCNSVMWPIIFPLAIKGLGIHTKQGSSYLIMAIVGGALIPPLMGLISDASQIQFAMLVPAVCYLYLLYYGLSGYKQRG